MRLNLAVEELRSATSLCLRCLVCTYGKWPENHPLCPIYQRHRVYTASPGGLIYLVRALSDRRVNCTPTMAEFAYQCTLCEACDICEIVPIPPPHVSPSDIIRFLRHELVKQDIIPERIRKVHQQVQKDGDYISTRANLTLPETLKDENTVLFVEGIRSQSERNVYESAIRLLRRIGKPVAIFDFEGGSCGTELYDLGFWDELDVLLKTTAKQMIELSGKEVLFINPHSQQFILKRYVDIQPQPLQLKGRHFSEIIVEAFNDGRLRSRGESINVSYHDPCHLGRGLGIYEAPRKVLSSLEVELVEMERNREDAYCCGAGGNTWAFPDFSNLVAVERIREFKETGAELLITACPYCKEAFQRLLSSEEKDRVKDLIEFVDERTS